MSTTPSDKKQPDLFQQWLHTCTPVQVYSVIALLGIIVSVYMKQYTMIPFNAVIAIVMILSMNWICERGYVWVSWALIFLPTILSILYAVFFKGIGSANVSY